ncbi:hypothetical protein [Nocardia sp. NBC_01009]|uniref:effector-associated constant component EACC1 n=1 Tax=Nocardia sp. NBC_01009 TaxID=2975996 RepID=UPI00386A079C|nr:hypothetical protein OHA42_23105 [Nocardia sp. NBC_01009]
MSVLIRVERQGSDDVRSLLQWLTDADGLRGHAGLIEPELERDKLGGLADTLTIALGAGGTATVVARATADVLIEWLRHRVNAVTVTIRRPDGSEMEFQAPAAQAWTPAEVDTAVNELTRFMEDSPDDDG